MRFTIKFDIIDRELSKLEQRRATARASYRKNPEKTIARVIEWQKANSEKVRATRSAYLENNRDQINAQKRAWRTANRVVENAKDRARYHKKRIDDPEFQGKYNKQRRELRAKKKKEE